MEHNTRAVIMELFGGTSDEETSMVNIEHEEEVHESDCDDIHEEEDEQEEANTNEEETRDEEEIRDEEAHNNEILEDGLQRNMVFESKEVLFSSYQAHAKHKGFAVVTRTNRKNKYLVLCCDRARKSTEKKFTKRVDCLARVNAIKQENGSWKVSTVHSTHNHDLNPEMSTFMPAHRNLSINMKRQLEANDIAGLRPCKNFRLMEVQAGGPQNLGCLLKDCTNFIDQRRKLRLGEGDAEAIRKLFIRMQQQDNKFFHLMDIDDDGRLRNVMWIHPRSIAAYEEFHDVVSFDTTYLVNQYQMPFATVVGVNHHSQSILLGCVLLTHEDAASFKWFFTNWLAAMGGVQPMAMLTDQCESIKITVREVLPDTIHRFCLWHIDTKISKKFKGVENHKDVVAEFRNIIYDSLTISEFEDRWSGFVRQHGLEDNRWLKDLYRDRHSWGKPYLNHRFWAGNVSTQRSESMHAFFDGYITSRSTLKMFVEQYEIAISNKVQKELHADCESKRKVIKCLSPFPWEEQFQKVYTNRIFDMVQNEIKKMWSCNVQLVCVDSQSGIESYEVVQSGTLDNSFHREFTFAVEYRPTGSYLSCNCRKFECKGLLCVHIMKVLHLKDIRSVDERYILRRWRKDVYRHHTSIFFAGGYPHMTKEYKLFQEVEREFQECIDMAYECPEKMQFVKQRCGEIKKELMKWTHINGTSVSHVNGETQIRQTTLLNPLVTRRRGRPRSQRFKSNSESIRLSASRGGRRGSNVRGQTRASRGGRGSNVRGQTRASGGGSDDIM